jgi:O-antigen biosynthesis protein
MHKLPLGIEEVLHHLDDADAVADLATKKFLMSQYPKPLRPLARLLARMVTYAAQVITIQQRQFNRHIFEAVRLLAQHSGSRFPGSAKALIGAEAVEARTKRELSEFLASNETIEIPAVAQPEVSVLLVLYNRAELTLNCLRSLLQNTFESLEIIIVDNASTDETRQLLQRIHGARIIHNSHNMNFIAGANQAARESNGQNLLFLNNDTQLDPYAIEAAMKTLNERPKAGAIGARLIFPSGRLQEAGSIIWKTGSCCGFGRDDAPDSFAFSYRRVTDYVSGAFLLTPRNLFESLRGFDMRFAPAYCEDADYCLALWQFGKEVIYEPDALVLHLESSSSQCRATAVELMRINQEKLRQKHKTWLDENHQDDRTENIPRASLARYGGKRILYLDDRVPHPELGSGFPRSQSIISRLANDGNFVTCYPMRFPHEGSFAARSALGRDIEVVSSLGLAGMEGFLRMRAGTYDVLWISRPHNLEYLAEIRKAHPEFFSRIRVIYDAEAIYCLRDIEQERMMGREIPPQVIERRVANELKHALNCDAIVVTSRDEKAWFERLGFKNIQVISFEFDFKSSVPGFDERQGFLFVGPILEEYCPNADAVERLVCRIFPAIGNTLGSEAQLRLIGYQGSSRIREIIKQNADPRIQVAGQVPQVDIYLHQARVFIAPTRFSAGVPNKVLEAAAHGLPVVATSLLATQLGWQTESEILVADSDEEIAAACTRLYNDEELWTKLRDGAKQRIIRDHNPAAISTVLRHLLSSTTQA